MQETEQGEPGAPQQHLVNILYIYNTEYEYKFVKDKIPKFIFQVLVLADTQFAEDQLLYGAADEDQPAACHINHRLQDINKIPLEKSV